MAKESTRAEVLERCGIAKPGADPGFDAAVRTAARAVRAPIEVRDTGHGMIPEIQARVFEPFFTTKAEGRGTGLGLATVCGIAAQSGGRITLDSAPGQGTSFVVHLSCAAGTREPRGSQAPRQAPRGGPETILLVEDDETVRRIVRTLLEAGSYQVIDTRDPEAALALLADTSRPVSLLLTDIHLPRMSGLELARRAREHRPDLKVLFMSGRQEEETGELAFPMLEKPFGADALVTKVRQVLDA